MGLALGRYPTADNSPRAKHVVAAGNSAWDAGSIPAASTISNIVRVQVKRRGLRRHFPNPACPARAGESKNRFGRVFACNCIFAVNSRQTWAEQLSLIERGPQLWV